MSLKVWLLSLALALPALPALAEEEYDLLPEGPGKEEVFSACSGCHSIRLVAQQGLDRGDWQETLTWMVEEQGMPELDPETEALVLGYLAQHFNRDHRPAAAQ